MTKAYRAIETRARGVGLDIFGGFHPRPGDGAPDGTGTLLLLGPHEPGFWDRVTAAPEFHDGAPDPMDRWSTRVITKLATETGAVAVFPFGGPPYQPFIAWAHRSGRAWASPVTLLVHDVAGLMVSYRGALALPKRITLPAPQNSPCETCADKPCMAACPVNALADGSYDVPECHNYLTLNPGNSCLSKGCAVRRACPVSQSYDRRDAQSSYHMSYFHR